MSFVVSLPACVWNRERSPFFRYDSLQSGSDPSFGALESLESVEFATLEWVSWFNHHRLLGSIGHIPPAEAEANYYRNQSEQARLV